MRIGRLRVTFYNELGCLFGPKMNWVDVDIVRVQFEKANYREEFEINLAIFGLCFCVEWFWGEWRYKNDN